MAPSSVDCWTTLSLDDCKVNVSTQVSIWRPEKLEEQRKSRRLKEPLSRLARPGFILDKTDQSLLGDGLEGAGPSYITSILVESVKAKRTCTSFQYHGSFLAIVSARLALLHFVLISRRRRLRTWRAGLVSLTGEEGTGRFRLDLTGASAPAKGSCSWLGWQMECRMASRVPAAATRETEFGVEGSDSTAAA